VAVARLIHNRSDLPPGFGGWALGRRVLLLMSRQGTATQEALVPLMTLRASGVEVVIGSDTAGPVAFDGPCNVLAWFERLWSPVHRYRCELERDGLDATAVDPADHAWLDRFDAVLVPGGHGPDYAAFIQSAFVPQVLHHVHAGDRIVALQCHSVYAAVVPGAGGEPPLGSGRQVTCWPRAYEAALGALPWVGRHFRPLGTPVQDLVAAVTGRVHVAANPRRMPHVVIDGPLVTSWGPWSGDLMAQAIVALIETRARDPRPSDPHHHAA
jgi:putative intracellular protease/amidase